MEEPKRIPGERRRSRRMARAVKVEARWEAGKERIRVKGETEMISAYGALVRLKTRHPIPERVELRNLETRQTSPATVLYSIESGEDASLRIAIALDTPGEQFWGDLTPEPH